MNMITSHNVILPKYLRIVKKKGSRISKTRAREGGASVFTALLFSFRISVPPSVRKKFWPSNQAGEKEGGWGEGIFARLFCAVGAAVGRKAFPPFGIKPNIKAKQFSIPLKRKRVARKNKELKRKLFCFACRVSAGGNAGAERQSSQSGFSSKKVRILTKRHRQFSELGFWAIVASPPLSGGSASARILNGNLKSKNNFCPLKRKFAAQSADKMKFYKPIFFLSP